MSFSTLSEKEEGIARKIVDAAYTVHKILGPGLLERVYEVCFCHELSKRGLKYRNYSATKAQRPKEKMDIN